MATHVDGLEWRRSKWGPRGKAYYRWAEQFGVRTADALIADAPGIADYYRHQFDVPTEMIRYGAPILDTVTEGALADVEELVRQETACCAFLTFQIEPRPGSVRLVVTAPEDARLAADTLFEDFIASGPSTRAQPCGCC